MQNDDHKYHNPVSTTLASASKAKPKHVAYYKGDQQIEAYCHDQAKQKPKSLTDLAQEAQKLVHQSSFTGQKMPSVTIASDSLPIADDANATGATVNVEYDNPNGWQPPTVESNATTIAQMVAHFSDEEKTLFRQKVQYFRQLVDLQQTGELSQMTFIKLCGAMHQYTPQVQIVPGQPGLAFMMWNRWWLIGNRDNKATHWTYTIDLPDDNLTSLLSYFDTLPQGTPLFGISKAQVLPQLDTNHTELSVIMQQFREKLTFWQHMQQQGCFVNSITKREGLLLAQQISKSDHMPSDHQTVIQTMLVMLEWLQQHGMSTTWQADFKKQYPNQKALTKAINVLKD